MDKNNNRKDRLRTLGTIDTYDLTLSDSLYNQENKPRNGSRHIHPLSKTKPQNNTRPTSTKKHNKSINSVFAHSRAKESTPKTKVKTLMGSTYNDGVRLKTDYSEKPVGVKRIVSQLKKKLVFPTQNTYRLDAMKILKKIHSNDQQQFYTAKKGGKLQKKYTLITTKQPRATYYDIQSKAYSKLEHEVSKKEIRHFLQIQHLWKQKRDYKIVVDNYLSSNWTDDKFYLFLNQFKNCPQLVIGFMKSVIQSIAALSKVGRAHSNIRLESIYFPLWKGALKADGNVKMGSLSSCISMKSKQQLLKMSISYHTPPEILNFILFESGQSFDRDYLQQITQVREGYQIDMWSLGIIILQLLNGGPLAQSDTDCYKLIELQRQLLIRYSYLLEKLDYRIHLCLSSMLSFSPRSRPCPAQIMKIII